MSAPAIRLSLSDIVAEYDAKVMAAPEVESAIKAAADHAMVQACIGSTYGDMKRPDVPSTNDIRRSLLHSAWRHVYDGLNISTIVGANEKKRIDLQMQNPQAFTLENIRDAFGDYVIRPRYHVLKGLAEVFGNLDPAFKSHTKMRVGVKGLPKRVIMSGFGGYSDFGRDRVRDMLRAIAACEGRPAPTYAEVSDLVPYAHTDGEGHGVRVKRFMNGNAHIHLDPATLLTVNRALAEFYGDVLPDVDPENPTRQPSTEVAKDLQYYPTPAKVVEQAIADLYIKPGQTALEPSCGCGRIMDALRKSGATTTGIEYHAGRASECRAKGHSVMVANFLEVAPDPRFDFVVMNPPFYGKHYAKHVEHAKRFLKPGGQLIAILPASARYDHGLLKGRWTDLPVGSFTDSGTNINTTIYRHWAERAAA
jgi:hypothetical protein